MTGLGYFSSDLGDRRSPHGVGESEPQINQQSLIAMSQIQRFAAPDLLYFFLAISLRKLNLNTLRDCYVFCNFLYASKQRVQEGARLFCGDEV